MIAIHTKFIRPTNTRGARIKAYTADCGDIKGFSVIVPYPYETGVKSHFEAVIALVHKYKLNWNLLDMRYGDSADGKGYVFCFDASKI